MKEVRNHVEYGRIYSEPRIKTGFRTKIYDASGNALLKVRMIVDKMFPGMFNVNRAKEGSWFHSIIITPKDKSLFINS